MTDADFGFDESEWLAPTTTIPDEESDDVMIEVLKDVEITEDMGPEERLRVLRTRYPEFEMLANEFVALQPTLVALQQDEQSSVTIVKARALAAYIASLSMYFALLTSPTSPADLRDHPVMDSLFSCRSLWTKVSFLKAPTPEVEVESDSEPEEETTTKQSTLPSPMQTQKSTTKQLAKAKAASQAATLRAQKIATADASLADLDSLLPSRTNKAKKTIFNDTTDDTNDFGESSHMTAAEAASKATRKKSLKFYTSQIAQKANKRTAGGRDAGGDADLPYKERLRDRVARLNAEATKRGKKLDAYGRGADLGGESGDEEDAGETEVAREVRQDGEDEYYDLVHATSTAKKAQKASLLTAAQAATEQDALQRVAEGTLDEDGKRAIGYVIEKNKGLAPKRKKDVRNPRVKKRKKYEEKKKKLGSMKAVYKGGEERGGYAGEKTGIKSGLVKSVKL